MALTDAGRNDTATKIIGGASTAFNAANAYLGVGDDNTAFNAAQTDLVAAANKIRKGMDSTYPQQVANALTFKATFGTTEGNFAWKEWGIFNAAAAGVMLNRVVQDLGTKTNVHTWQFTVSITVTNP